MSVRQILKTFDEWRADGRPMVLATVYETLGSTYSKAGHRILIDGDGLYQGLVSGGCLEGDLAERARGVLETNRTAPVTYDMRGEMDEIFGLGVGCDGLIRVLLQPLVAARGYQPFASIAQHLVGSRPSVVATVIESGLPGIEPGATLIAGAGARESWGLEEAGASLLASGCERALAAGETRYVKSESGLAVLYATLKPVPRLLLLGAALDAVPLVNMATDLGWRVTVADHRPAYLERGDLGRAEQVIHVVPRLLAETVRLADFDAIVVMSHHLVTDRTYLGQLAGVDARYLGILGPRARKERLLAALEESAPALRGRVRGPIGLDIGADSPESIALSVLAEVQATLSQSAAKPLSA